ncbi:MAG: hypothetical protein ACT6UU_23540 [Hydrogenophaga sp.]|uniref:hypothetical protein n=1 Tax=Hydrogenophaga sp. TaxID=1904254 RepID=UPI004035637F
MDICSRSAQRLMTLSVATSITPEISCCQKQQDRVLTWVSFRWALLLELGQFSVEDNNLPTGTHESSFFDTA